MFCQSVIQWQFDFISVDVFKSKFCPKFCVYQFINVFLVYIPDEILCWCINSFQIENSWNEIIVSCVDLSVSCDRHLFSNSKIKKKSKRSVSIHLYRLEKLLEFFAIQEIKLLYVVFYFVNF